jgi:hypothetical protein
MVDGVIEALDTPKIETTVQCRFNECMFFKISEKYRIESIKIEVLSIRFLVNSITNSGDFLIERIKQTKKICV